MMHAVFSLALFTIGFVHTLGENCLARDYGNETIVCVCNAEHCDTIAKVEAIEQGNYLVYTSNKAGLRFNLENGLFDSSATTGNVITVNKSKTYQEIFGWGGAFTDAAGININSLSSAARQNLLRSYFSDDGLEYSLCRVPIGGTDFSTEGYSYLNETGEEDIELNTFSLRKEDYELKIPLIQEAMNLTHNNLRLFASAWIAPKFMKLNNAYAGILGFLKRNMYQPWANYYLKFLESYDKENVTFWGITTGNEPSLAFFPVKIPSVGWLPNLLIEWVNNNLGPTLRNSKFSNISIMALDDQRIFLPWYINLLFNNETTENYIDGIAVHWYFDSFIPASKLSDTHDNHPEKFILATEACVGSDSTDDPVVLGSWSRGQKYANSIIEDVNNWVTGWVDWNMALDETGGPTYIDNNVDSPIIVNATGDEFYKQPTYYALGHFSKFVPRGSVKIDNTEFASDVPAAAFKRPDGGVVVVILNQRNEEVPVVVVDSDRGNVNLNLSASSLTSILYW